MLTSLLLSCALLGAPASAVGRHGGDQGVVRVTGTCGGGARSELKLKADDRGIEVELEVHRARRGSAWHVVIVQEGRVALRTTVRAGRSSGAFSMSRQIRDLAGADRISVRAAGPQGVTCRALGTLPGA
ncbi:hypothetical protein FSW04_16540 [Baekduia soli]|uniref:Uncharacterized protein n=1 Tax=Baekduia soli TaxID=496014 RepID=A0A5B8U7U9_9ACTN|nr:hypothetical protein [Baekduia soli]QEC49021.1 hypothetical protein FSW04_16540 [Baekduia soli]